MVDEKRSNVERKKNISLAIDASRNRSGGAIAHLKGILAHSNPREFGITHIHLWSYKKLLDDIPDKDWLIKHSHPSIEKSILQQIYWQRYTFKSLFNSHGCDILLNPDAGTLSRIKPCVTMSRDMLSYEPGIGELYGFSLARIRIILLGYIQNRALARASGVIFLTRYASTSIQKFCGKLTNLRFIPHGVGEVFKNNDSKYPWPKSKEQTIECVYVSNIDKYKNHASVLKAFRILWDNGLNVKITFVGGGSTVAKRKFSKMANELDPKKLFSRQVEYVDHKELSKILSETNLFVFASSCENMPNTLIEGMSCGLPIACSAMGPMPEVLKDGGIYFNPTNPDSIATAIAQIIRNPKLRQRISKRSLALSKKYTWKNCGDQTWRFLSDIANSKRV